ncbi:MAG: cyanophycin synthetase [bacterium]
MTARSSSDEPAGVYQGEPGIGPDLSPPFTAEDDITRWLFSLNRFGIRPGLARIDALLDELDHPERQVTSLVVAGTNGKGSSTRILAGLLRAAGYRVACFTSPHLLRVYERLTIDDQPCDPAHFAAEVHKLRPAVERHGASWFETLTALALDLCRAAEVDYLCCEVGLGGRLDATNALPAEAILLTTVARDHCRILGDSLAEIADEKLGLLKSGVPLFCGVNEALRSQVFTTAVAAGAPCFFLDELAEWQPGGDHWTLRTRRREIRDLPDLPAPVLRRNFALAWLCLEELAAAGSVRLPADPAAALAGVFLPGRFQQVLQDPDWIFDTAHNEEALLACLDGFLARPVPGRRFVLFSSMQHKDLGPAVGDRLRACDEMVAAPVRLPRSRNRDELTALLGAWQLPPAGSPPVQADSSAAITYLARKLTPEDTVLVTGSGFLVAETLYRLGYNDIEETRGCEAAAHRLAPYGYVNPHPGRQA